MTRRRYLLDTGPGEQRAVVLLNGRAERLMISRNGDAQIQGLDARLVARVKSIERGLGLAFLDLGQAPDAVLNLNGGIGPVREGDFIEVEIRSEARHGKGAQVRWLAAAEGPIRLLAAPPSLEQRVNDLARSAPIETGKEARAAADIAQDEVLETVFPLSGGGSIAIEPTRALTAVDVDVGGRGGNGDKRAARSANLAGLAEAARVLRLKGLGGLTAIDLAGRGHDGPALLAAARAAFTPDNPGVAFGPISRFGVLELTIPRRSRPTLEIIVDGGAGPSAATLALALIRALEDEATRDGGGRFEAVASAHIAAAATPYMKCLTDRFGARLALCADAGRRDYEIRKL